MRRHKSLNILITIFYIFLFVGTAFHVHVHPMHHHEDVVHHHDHHDDDHPATHRHCLLCKWHQLSQLSDALFFPLVHPAFTKYSFFHRDQYINFQLISAKASRAPPLS